MRLARKLFLFAVMAMAAVAFAAPSAFGQSIEVMNEDDTSHCGDVTVDGHEATGECQIVAHSIDSSHLPQAFGNGVLLSAGGMTLLICTNEFEGYFDESGNGLITHQELNDVPGLGDSCQIAPCQESAGNLEPWPAQWNEPEPGVETLTFTFCISAGGAETGANPCEINVDVHQDVHHYIFDAEDAGCHGPNPAEITGEWESENDLVDDFTNTEVEHPDPDL